jgi:hypothetical protein
VTVLNRLDVHAVLLAVLLAGCSSSDPTTTSGADSGASDSAASGDSQTASDGGTTTDTGSAGDAGTNLANTCAQPPNLATVINETQESQAFPTTFTGGVIPSGVYLQTRRGVYPGGTFNASKTYKITSYVDAATQKFLFIQSTNGAADIWAGGSYTINGTNVTFDFTCGPASPAQVTKAFDVSGNTFTVYDLTQKFADTQVKQ